MVNGAAGLERAARGVTCKGRRHDMTDTVTAVLLKRGSRYILKGLPETRKKTSNDTSRKRQDYSISGFCSVCMILNSLSGQHSPRAGNSRKTKSPPEARLNASKTSHVTLPCPTFEPPPCRTMARAKPCRTTARAKPSSWPPSSRAPPASSPARPRPSSPWRPS